MIKDYLKERRSWILLFCATQLLTIFIAYIDSTIPVMQILYVVFLSVIIFIIFLVFRYKKETRFYQSLEEWAHDLDLTDMAVSESPFEKIIEKSIINQTEQLKEDNSRNRILFEQEKDELLSWIHEVKTPLTAMHLMIDRIDDEKIKAQLKHEWLRIHLLLDQQLHQKRLPFMENDLFIEELELQHVIFNEIKGLQSWCIQKGIGVDVDLEVSKVLSDGKWLAFIIRQLLTNAIKYSERTDIVIKSFQKQELHCLEVQDFGRGIDPKDLPRIFDKGFTSTTHHQDHTATGMGLFLAKKAAQPLLIKIDVHSKLGEGTTFTLTFPKRNDFNQITGM
nr:sensor histidine kinase [Neobacillus sp. Marseille-Q6967]